MTKIALRPPDDVGRSKDGHGPLVFAAVGEDREAGGPVLRVQSHDDENRDDDRRGDLAELVPVSAVDLVAIDLNYDRRLCRNISVDIRYVLWVIDKYAGAGYLIEEMNIIE